MFTASLIPESAFVKEVGEFIKDTESALLFNHSSRVFCFAHLAGQKKRLRYDPELLYVAAMFHDIGLVPKYSSKTERFEVDGANEARIFLERHNIDPIDIQNVWTAIALHTTPGIPQHMHPVIALLTNGVEMDVLGIEYDSYSEEEREKIVSLYPRTEHFKEDIIQTFYDGIKHKPHTTFGNVKADVLADKDKTFKPANFCSIIRHSHWKG